MMLQKTLDYVQPCYNLYLIDPKSDLSIHELKYPNEQITLIMPKVWGKFSEKNFNIRYWDTQIVKNEDHVSTVLTKKQNFWMLWWYDEPIFSTDCEPALEVDNNFFQEFESATLEGATVIFEHQSNGNTIKHTFRFFNPQCCALNENNTHWYFQWEEIKD